MKIFFIILLSGTFFLSKLKPWLPGIPDGRKKAVSHRPEAYVNKKKSFPICTLVKTPQIREDD